MANLILAMPTISDPATMAAVGSEAAGMEAVNLFKKQPSDLWRATDLGNIWFEVDLGSAQAIRLIALLFTNATSAATIRVRGATSQANLTAAPGYDSTAVSHWPTTGLDNWEKTHAILWLSSAQTYQWWRIDVVDAANPDGYYQAGRLYLANPYQPSVNIQYGWGVGFIDGSPTSEATDGQLYIDERKKYRVLNFTLDFESESDMYGDNTAFDIDLRRGSSRDVLCIVDPEKTARLMDWSIYGRMQGLRPIVNNRFDLYMKPYTIREMI